MKHAIKKLWAAALCSRQFVQGHTRLRTARAFGYEWCCLGVLCELHRELTGRGEWTEAGYVAWGDDGVRCQASNYVLPPPVLAWAGLDEETGNPMAGDSSLGALNDGNASEPSNNLQPVPALTFPQIAAIIDDKL
jgi:hypothetical protein